MYAMYMQVDVRLYECGCVSLSVLDVCGCIYV